MGGVYNLINLHVYHYAGNNPLKYTDPDGNTPKLPGVINAVNLDFGSDYISFARANFSEGEYSWSAVMVADALSEAAYDALIVYGIALAVGHMPDPAIVASTISDKASSIVSGIRSFIGNIGNSNAVQKMMSSATSQYNNGPLSNVGRALPKHPNVIGESGNILSKLGGAEGVNKAGENVLSSIISTGAKTIKDTVAFGKVIEYKLGNGIGARFSEKTKEFIGFLGRGVE
jgi:hypothetical protein